MIAYLKGIVAAVDPYSLVLDVNGVGYELAMSTKALASLPAVGNTVQVSTYMQVKDDGISLFGFMDAQEKAMFTRLVGVSGIGPKMALAALSTYAAGELAAVIAEGDVTMISRVPGIGKKTAQRVVLELQGVLKTESQAVPSAPQGSALADASAALQSMGFSADEVAAAFKGVAADGHDVSALIKLGLKSMGGR